MSSGEFHSNLPFRAGAHSSRGRSGRAASAGTYHLIITRCFRSPQSLACTSAVHRAADIDTDLLAVPVFEGEERASRTSRHRQPRPAVSSNGHSCPVSCRAASTNSWSLRSRTAGVRSGIAFVGAGKRSEFTTERLRRVATAAALQSTAAAGRSASPGSTAAISRSSAPVQAAAEGLALSRSARDRYKSGERARRPVDRDVHRRGRPDRRSRPPRGRDRARPHPGRVVQHRARALATSRRTC